MRGVLAFSAACLLWAGSAAADPEPAAERYEELLPSFDEVLRVASAAAEDEATLLEAAEIAAIAEELSAEGDSGIAVTLLEEAIALLAPPDEE